MSEKTKPKTNSAATKLLLDPALMATAAAEPWANLLFPGTDMSGMVEQMRQVTTRVKAGDTTDIEAMLLDQAMALQTIFTNLSRRAAAQEYITNFQTMFALALKCQAACRQTLEALGELKQPRTVVVAQQANVAHQQINHQAAIDKCLERPSAAEAPSHAHAESTAQENELIEPRPKEGTRSGVGLPPFG